MLVIPDPDSLLLKPGDQPFDQGGLAYTGKPGEAQERGFKLFPVTVHGSYQLRRFDAWGPQGDFPI